MRVWPRNQNDEISQPVYRCALAPPSFMSFSTSAFIAIEVLPGVVIAGAP